MKLNPILLAALMVSISQAAVAAEIYKGKVLNTKLWADDGSKVRVINTKHHDAVKNKGFVYADVFIDSQKAAVNQPVSVSKAGNSQTHIENNSDEERTYFVRQTVCAEVVDHNVHCLHRYIDLSLEPNGYYSDDALPDLTAEYSVPGTYKINIETGIINFNHDSSTFANADGYVVVS